MQPNDADRSSSADRSDPDAEPAFAAAFALADPIPGWLTREQARVLHRAVTEAAGAGRAITVLEVGSHLGRSMTVLGRAVRDRAPAGSRCVAVDPFGADWRYGRADTETRFRAALQRAGIAEVVEVRVATSDAIREGWTEPIDVVFVDGKHDYWSTRRDLRWAGRLTEDGVLLIHDAFSSLGVTTALLVDLVAGDGLIYRGRTGSLARLEPGRPGPMDRLRPLRELPWWLRNLAVKVLLRLRARPLARLLGHDDPADPY